MSYQIEDTYERYKCYTCGTAYAYSPTSCSSCSNDWVGGWYNQLTFKVEVFKNLSTPKEKPIYTGMVVADCYDSFREHEYELKKKHPSPQYEVVCEDVTDEGAQP